MTVIDKIDEYLNEGKDDFTGIVTKSLPFYAKGAKISIRVSGGTFYAKYAAEDGTSSSQKFENKDDVNKWISGMGIRGIKWGKAKF